MAKKQTVTELVAESQPIGPRVCVGGPIGGQAAPVGEDVAEFRLGAGGKYVRQADGSYLWTYPA